MLHRCSPFLDFFALIINQAFGQESPRRAPGYIVGQVMLSLVQRAVYSGWIDRADRVAFDGFGKILYPLTKEVFKVFGVEHGEYTPEGVV